MESKEELSSASYEESIINKISKGMTSLARNQRKHWKETNKQMMKRRKQIKVIMKRKKNTNKKISNNEPLERRTEFLCH